MCTLRIRAVLLPAIFITFFLIFLQTAAPSVFFGDSGELQAVALKGGVAHPSGYPTFILLGQVFGGVLGGDPAHRITMMSVFFGAAAVCVLFLVLVKLGLPVWAALAGTAVYGLSFTFWWSAIRAEVYTLSIFLFLTSFWLVLHTFEKPTLARAAAAAACLGLTLTGHLAFAPAVMVLGLMLAFKKPEKSKRLVYAPLILITFIAGLTPYLYLVWADSGDYPMNYLKYTIELSTRQFGLTEETFSNPFRRIFWLIGGQESRSIVNLSSRVMARTSMQLAITEFIYQFGLLALPVFIIGAWKLLKKPDRKTWALVGIFTASTVFCVVNGNRRMLPIFAMPLTITVAVVISFGILALRERLSGDRKRLRFREISAGIIFLGLMIATPHLIRGRWDQSGIVKTSMKIMLEAGPEINTVIPTLRDYMEPRIYGERILELVPPNSLVVGKWKIMVLYYLHYVEGMRPDIELDPYDVHHFIRLQRWEEEHDLNSHPIVFVGPIGGMVEDIAGLTEVPIDEEESIYICRGPLKWNKNSRFIKDDSQK